MRFVVDHCVPAEVARWLTTEGHEAWTAYEARLEDADDGDLIAYAYSRQALLVTTNRDCAQLGRRLRTARLVWLMVREADAIAMMTRAVEWLGRELLPDGRVLRVTKNGEPQVLAPVRF